MPEAPPDETLRHERPEVPLRPLLWTVGGLVVLVVGAAVGLELLFGTPAPAKRETETAGPPLQEHPALDLARFEAAQEAREGALEWVDRDRGIARIPVVEAMRIIAARGVPSRGTEAGCNVVGQAAPRAPQAECGR